MLWNYAFLNRGLTLTFNGKPFKSENGLRDLLQKNLSGEPLYPIVHLEGDDIEVAFTHGGHYGEEYFSFRWHPYAVDPKQDYSKEPTTLVVFELHDDPKGTRLKITESGFDQIPVARRAEAFRMNSGGWEAQIQNIAKYVDEKQ